MPGRNMWNPPETAPKDRPILLDVGFPTPVIGAYNPVAGEWTYGEFQIGLFDGEWNDTYFECEYTKKINGWMPLPEVASC